MTEELFVCFGFGFGVSVSEVDVIVCCGHVCTDDDSDDRTNTAR